MDYRVSTLGKYRRDQNFWSKEKQHIFKQIWAELRQPPPKLLRYILPRIARHFDGKAEANLKKKNAWLVEFEPRSESGLNMSKAAFFENGTEFIDTLNAFSDLIRSDSQLGIMLEHKDGLGMRVLLATREELERLEPSELDSADKIELSKTDEKILEANIGSGIDPSRVLELLTNHREASKVNTPHQRKTRKTESEVAARCIFEVHWPAWKAEFDKANPSSGESRKKGWRGNDKRRKKREEYMVERYLAYLDKTEKNLNDLNVGHILSRYQDKVRTFVSHVGCPRNHEKLEDNMDELRQFLSTTMGHFAKLQEQYLKKELEVQKLRHYITALEFRYLLENLPEPDNTKSAGSRWESFWKQALEHDADKNSKKPPEAPTHPLKHLVDVRNKARHFPDKGKMVIHTTNQKGFLFETGNIMYTALSDEIHRCNYGGEYKIHDSDGWSSVITEILDALKPMDANIDKSTHVVDWEAERARYLK